MSCSPLKSLARVGLGDAQDRVIGVTVRTGMLVFAGLIEDRVDLALEMSRSSGAGGGSRERRARLWRDRGLGPSARRVRAFFNAGSAVRALTRRASDGSLRISPCCSTVERASRRTCASGSTSSRLRYSSVSGRLKNPTLVEASVSPRRRKAGSSSARADKSSLLEPLPAQSAGRLLIPRRVRSRTAADGSVTARRKTSITCSRGSATSTRAGRANNALDRLQSLGLSQARPAVQDDGQNLGVVNDRPAQDRQQAGRGLVALQERADRRQDLRPLAQPLVTPDHLQDGLPALFGSLQGRLDQGDAFGVIFGAVEVEIFVGDDGLRGRADFGLGDRRARARARSGSTAFRVRPGSLKKPASSMAWRRAVAGRSAVRSRVKTASSDAQFRLIKEAELAVVADVDHGLGLASKRSALEKRSVERGEHRRPLEVVPMFERGQDGSQ